MFRWDIFSIDDGNYTLSIFPYLLFLIAAREISDEGRLGGSDARSD